MSRKSSRKARGAPVAKGSSSFIGGWRDLTNWMGIGGALIDRINVTQAMMQSALSAGLDVLSQDIAKNALGLYRGDPDTAELLDYRAHPWARRLSLDPNDYHRWTEVWAMTVTHLALHQNAYIIKRRRTIGDQFPELIPVPPDQVTVQSYDGRFAYDVSATNEGQAAIFGFRSQRLLADDVIHIRFRQWNGVDGLSTLLIGADVLGLNKMLVEFQAALTRSGVRPNSAIQVPVGLKDEDFERLRMQATQAFKDAAMKGTPLILEQGATIQKLSFNAAEMDLVRARLQLHQEVARLLRMPPHKIGLLESVKAENLQQIEQAYVDDTLIPIAVAVESALNSALLTERERLSGLRFMFDRFGLYNRDPGARQQTVIDSYKAGVITRGQASHRLGFGKVAPALDTYAIPVNTTIQGRDGALTFVTPNKAQPGDGAPVQTQGQNNG